MIGFGLSIVKRRGSVIARNSIIMHFYMIIIQGFMNIKKDIDKKRCTNFRRTKGRAQKGQGSQSLNPKWLS